MKHPTEKHIKEVHRKAIAAKDYGVIAAVESLYPELGTHIEYDSNRIYASKPYTTVYKLHRVGDVWMFCQLGRSEGGSRGRHATPEEAIKEESEDAKVEIFHNQKDFLRWALKKSS